MSASALLAWPSVTVVAWRCRLPALRPRAPRSPPRGQGGRSAVAHRRRWRRASTAPPTPSADELEMAAWCDQVAAGCAPADR